MKIIIDNVYSKLSEAPTSSVVERIREELRYKNDADNPYVRKKFQHQSIQIAEYKYLYHKGNRTFPTGCLSIVEDILKKAKTTYEKVDNRLDYPIIDPLPLLSYKLRDYQESSKVTALAEKNCIIRIATGGGKTAIMTALAATLHGHDQIIFVRRQMLLVQTIEVYRRELGIDIGQIGLGVVDIKPITVAMIPTVARSIDPKYKFKKEDDDDEDDKTKLSAEQKAAIAKYLAEVKCLTIDECHCLGADTAQLVSRHAKQARYRWGFSATDWRDDGKDILLTAVTGPRAVDIDASYLIERGYLVPPHIYFLRTPSSRIPFFMQGKYQDVYKEFVVENKARNQLIVDKAIEGYNRFEKTVILVRQIEHGRLLEEMLLAEGVWVEYISGKNTMITRKEVLAQFSKRSRTVLIGSSILDEGVDVPEISTLINAGGGKSSGKYYQQIGRAIRLAKDKKRAIVIDFLDDSIKFLRNHSKARRKLIKTETLYKLKIQGTPTSGWGT